MRLLDRTLQIAWIAVMLLFTASVGIWLAVERTIPAGRLGLIVSAYIGFAFRRSEVGTISSKQLLTLVACAIPLIGTSLFLRFNFFESATFSPPSVLLSWAAAYGTFILLWMGRSGCYPKSLVWLGTVSYSIYLLHPFWIWSARHCAHGSAFVLLVLAGSLVSAYYAHRFIETPAIELGKRFRRRPTLTSSVMI